MISFLYLLLSTAFATPYYGVHLDNIQNLKHQSFQSHELGWSGISKEGLTGYRIGLEPGWEYSFMGGRPVYQQDGIEFIELPTQITICNRLARSYRFALVVEKALSTYQLLPEEIPVLKPTRPKKSKPPTIK